MLVRVGIRLTRYYQCRQQGHHEQGTPQQPQQYSQQGNSKQGYTPTNTTSRERNYITIKAVTQPSTQTPTTQHGNSKQQYRQQINGYRQPQQRGNNKNTNPS